MPLPVPDILPAHETDYPIWPNVDLGEFMMDNDLDILGRMFNFNQPNSTAI